MPETFAPPGRRGPRVDVSVITATCRRPAQLAMCLHHFRRQSLGGLRCEHIVVSDGPDRHAEYLADRCGAKFDALPEQRGHAGAFAKDRGIELAQGEFVCFWDDDNFYEPHALSTLFAAAIDADIGVVQVRHRLRKNVGMTTIPRCWSGRFTFGDVDTMCVIVRTSLARQELWGDDNPLPGTDYRWLAKLEQHAPRIRFVPVVIGEHL